MKGVGLACEEKVHGARKKPGPKREAGARPKRRGLVKPHKGIDTLNGSWIRGCLLVFRV